MATHRITMTEIGADISDPMQLQYWDGAAWENIATVSKTALLAGHEFVDMTGAETFRLVSTSGACEGEFIEFNCEAPTTTVDESTTTEVPTTTEAPTTTEEAPTTTLPAGVYEYYVTARGEGCGDTTTDIAYASDGNVGTVSQFYVDHALSVTYAGAASTIGYKLGGIGLPTWVADIDIDGALTNNAPCV